MRVSVRVLSTVAAIVLVLVLVGARGAGTPHHTRPCTHGVSSLGPLEIANGQAAGGSTTPQTEACLP
jgi:hypothetical protein